MRQETGFQSLRFSSPNGEIVGGGDRFSGLWKEHSARQSLHTLKSSLMFRDVDMFYMYCSVIIPCLFFYVFVFALRIGGSILY